MKKFKLCIDKDKEEEWLNNLSKKGWAMKKYFLGLYTFERSDENYIYRIDLLKNWEGDRKEFEEFMEDSGVEYVAQWYRWVFLRKRIQNGNFELYSDSDSLIEHYSRIQKFFLVVAIIEFICALAQLPMIISYSSISNGIVFLIAMIFAGSFLRMVKKYFKKINTLKNTI